MFNLTDNVRLDETRTKIIKPEYYTRAILYQNEEESEKSEESHSSNHSDKGPSPQKNQVLGELRFGKAALVVKVSQELSHLNIHLSFVYFRRTSKL